MNTLTPLSCHIVDQDESEQMKDEYYGGEDEEEYEDTDEEEFDSYDEEDEKIDQLNEEEEGTEEEEYDEP